MVEPRHQARCIDVALRPVKCPQQPAAPRRTHAVHAPGKSQVRNLIRIRIRIAVGRKRVISHAQIRGAMIAGHQPDGVRRRQPDISRYPRFPRPLQLGDDRPCRRILRRQARRVRPQVAGEHPVGGGEVVAVIMIHRSDDRHLVHQPRVLGQELRDLHPGNGRRNRLERSPKFGRRIRLGIISLMLRWSAVEPDQDHRFPGSVPFVPSPRNRPRTKSSPA